MDEKVIYSCVDQEHNTWNCRGGGRAGGKRLELLPRLRP